MTIRISKVHEADPHPDHELGELQILGPFGTSHWIRAAILWIAQAFGVVENEGDFLEMDSAQEVRNAVDLDELQSADCSNR